MNQTQPFYHLYLYIDHEWVYEGQRQGYYETLKSGSLLAKRYYKALGIDVEDFKVTEALDYCYPQPIDPKTAYRQASHNERFANWAVVEILEQLRCAIQSQNYHLHLTQARVEKIWQQLAVIVGGEMNALRLLWRKAGQSEHNMVNGLLYNNMDIMPAPYEDLELDARLSAVRYMYNIPSWVMPILWVLCDEYE